MILFSKEEYEDDEDISSRTCCMLAAMDTKCRHLLIFLYGFHMHELVLTGIFQQQQTYFYLSLDIFSARICLFSAGSIATPSHMSSDPTLIIVSSIMN
jgi:hypothetical protein